jgi:hypothetical protein
MVYMIDEGTRISILYNGDELGKDLVVAEQFKSGDRFLITRKDGNLCWTNVDQITHIKYKMDGASGLPDGYKPIPGTFERRSSEGGF